MEVIIDSREHHRIKTAKKILQTIWKPSTANGVENHSRKHTTDKYTAHQNATTTHN